MIATEQMQLRAVEEKDLEQMLAWRNSERISANMYTGHVITLAEHRAWFARLTEEGRAFAFLFEVSGRPLGVVNLTQMDRVNGTCHWGFYIGEAGAPPGSGTRMAYLALTHIFERLNLRKVIGEAFAFNQASIAYHKKLGFSQEAHFVKHVLKDGRYEDIISFALLKSDWLRLKPQIEKNYFPDRNEP